MKEEIKVISEKTVLFTIAVGSISAGISAITDGLYVQGAILVAVGVGVIVLREYLNLEMVESMYRGGR